MANSKQSNRIIICDASAFRALRCERRRYQSLGWTPLSSRKIQLAVSYSSANADCIDYDLLEQLGIWSPGEKLHLLVNSQSKRRHTGPVSMHVLSKPLPMGSLCNLVFPASSEILEYKGHPYDSKESRIRDEKREAGLSAMGFRVTSINNEQIKDAAALEAIAKRLYRQSGLRFRYYIDAYRTKQYQLMRELATWMRGENE